MHKMRIIFEYLLGTFFALLLTVFTLLLIVRFTVYDKSYINNILEENHYREKINEEIKEEMSMAILSTGFTDEILKDLYTEEELYNDMNTFMNNLYDGEITQLDKQNIREKLNENITNFLTKSNLKIINEDDVNAFMNDVVDIYQNEATLYHMVDNYIAPFAKIGKYLNTIIIILGIILFALMIVVAIMKSKILCSSILASGLIILFIRLFIFERIDADYILIITEKFSNILQIVLNRLGEISLIVALSLIGFGILYLCQAALIFKKKKRKMLKYEM